MKLRTGLGLCGLLLLAACKPGVNSTDNQDLAANLNAPFDYYINGMRTERFSADGKPAFHLSADRATHFPADDHIELGAPVMHWLNANADPWVFSANEGNLHRKNGTEELTLTGSVTVNTVMPNTGNIQLETSRLNVLPKTRTAVTDADVKFSNSNSSLRGTGMKLDMATNSLELQGTRGTYAH